MAANERLSARQRRDTHPQRAASRVGTVDRQSDRRGGGCIDRGANTVGGYDQCISEARRFECARNDRAASKGICAVERRARLRPCNPAAAAQALQAAETVIACSVLSQRCARLRGRNPADHAVHGDCRRSSIVKAACKFLTGRCGRRAKRDQAGKYCACSRQPAGPGRLRVRDIRSGAR